jgi:hypothetical protein
MGVSGKEEETIPTNGSHPLLLLKQRSGIEEHHMAE